jgi:hypothetical protein
LGIVGLRQDNIQINSVKNDSYFEGPETQGGLPLKAPKVAINPLRYRFGKQNLSDIFASSFQDPAYIDTFANQARKIACANGGSMPVTSDWPDAAGALCEHLNQC